MVDPALAVALRQTAWRGLAALCHHLRRDQEDCPSSSRPVGGRHYRHLHQLSVAVLGGHQHRPRLLDECLEARR